jgi:asparagine synthase (glutamine-hydrolysing)
MCGIAGFIDFQQRSNEVILKKMTDSLSHRGPDGEGFYFSTTDHCQVGLGHRRLSIIDLTAAGSQPMHFDGLHVIFNGEIYNYAEIRTTLIKKGHSFESHSDTEVILHSIREWGIKAVDQWKGMFAIVLYDEKENEIICIRDRAGVKPFYYYWDQETLIFASELKAVRHHPSFKKEVSPDAVASFFQYGYVPNPHCIFKQTYKLQPGHYLKFDLTSKQLVEKSYWSVYDYYNKPKLSIDKTEAIKETEQILSKAFQYRMVADVPVGVFLSGGFDSTCVTALLQKNSSEKIKTFTIGTTDKRYNEAPFAKKIAEYLGTEHTEYYCTPGEALEIIPELPYYYDEPFADSSAIPTILVSRLARKKVTVALSADAGDEIFAGYERYHYLLKYNRKINRVPKSIRKAMVGVMDTISSESIPYFRNTYNFHSRYQKVKALLNDPEPSKMMKGAVQAFSDVDVKSVMATDVFELANKVTSSELLEEYYDPLSYMMAVDYQTYMTDDILQKVDRATMSASLEGREPYLDQDIIEWAAQLPSEYKYYKGEKKYLLKQIVYKHIPQDLLNRPKMGFSIPIDYWLSNELKDLVDLYLDDSKMDHGLLNKQYVCDLKQSFYSGKRDLYMKIWYILMFQMWYNQWMKSDD